MASSIKANHMAVMAGPNAERAMRFLVKRCSGTTSSASDQRVGWIGNHLMLLAWDYGGKTVEILRAPRHNTTQAEMCAMRRLLPDAGSIPNRLAGGTLDEWIRKLIAADEVWDAVVTEEEKRLIAAAEEVARGEDAARVAQRMEDALVVRLLKAVADAERAIGVEIRLAISPEEHDTARAMLARAVHH